MKLKIFIGLLLALAPAFASATPKPPTAHLRPQLYHDRSPKARIHQSLPHHA
ncbi:hypothetical protein [Tunturiibacter gelidoferens]|uniref:Uncharacterized protein n=3 Tax=Tunturiibacter TaxID=3154218 RepID=A0A7Y9T3E9_9BACT|nr:hypothetical protein [Edaphobacter lichenicola]MBB5340391.1 hypothetical protein [Edaphobacter lichenicola]NYF50294.1 hypothetical protein [Edaphobacter lichenicola]